MVRFGVLGAGRIGKVHARTLAESGRASVAFVADAVPQAAAELAGTVGALPPGFDTTACFSWVLTRRLWTGGKAALWTYIRRFSAAAGAIWRTWTCVTFPTAGTSSPRIRFVSKGWTPHRCARYCGGSRRPDP